MAPKKEKAPAPVSKPTKSGGGKQKKKKWSKGKQKEKVNNAVLFDQASYDKMLTEVPKYKMITPSVLSDRLRILLPRLKTALCSSTQLLNLKSFVDDEILVTRDLLHAYYFLFKERFCKPRVKINY